MTDPLSLATVREAAASSAPTQPVQPPLDPGETRLFASMMGGSAAPGSVVVDASANLPGAAQAYAAQLTAPGPSLDDIRHSMLASIDPGDPIKTMFMMTDHAMQAQMTFSRLHISTSLASAATGLFGSLLKNQQ